MWLTFLISSILYHKKMAGISFLFYHAVLYFILFFGYGVFLRALNLKRMRIQQTFQG